jgi:4-hydroxybenzoate polyprenyltransferase
MQWVSSIRSVGAGRSRGSKFRGSMNLSARIATWGSLVKFSHSVFALPFALMMAAVLSRSMQVSPTLLVLLIVCVVAARTSAMAFNRIVDCEIDRRNPRTAGREMPKGAVSMREAWLLALASAVIFIAGAGLIGRHCLVLAPAVLVILFGYSLMKRVSASCHFVLGLALACAPGGVWYALTGEWSAKPLPLMAAVLCWVAGFDILYSCQDRDFDRSSGLRSVPAKIGLRAAIVFAAALHACSIGLLALFGLSFGLGAFFWIGLSAFSMLLASQYLAISARGIPCIDQVFFTRNGLASVLLFLAVLADTLAS